MISVILPTYNRVDLLPQAIASVLGQAYQDWELWVADDGSTDDTPDLMTQFRGDPRILYLRLPHSGLPAVARNAALDRASGEFVALLDSDDRWLPGKLARQVEMIEHHPATGLVCSNALADRSAGKPTEELYLNPSQGRSGRVLHDLLRDNFVVTSTAMVRRSVLDQVGRFCEEPSLRAVEDYDLWLQIAAVAEVAYCPDALAIYREHGNSIRSAQSQVEYWRAMLLILDRLEEYLRAHGGWDVVTPGLIKQFRFRYECTLSDAYLAARSFGSIAPCWLHLFRRQPLPAARFISGRVARLSVRVVRRRLYGSQARFGIPTDRRED